MKDMICNLCGGDEVVRMPNGTVKNAIREHPNKRKQTKAFTCSRCVQDLLREGVAKIQWD